MGAHLSEDTPGAGVWKKHAKQWALIGSPLRPTPEDSAVLEAVVRAWAAENGVPRAMILGVTPEMTTLDWPANTDLIAVDYAAEMIRTVWPGWPKPGQGALQANWCDIPLPDSSRDIVLSDGCFAALPCDGHADMLGQVRRILSPAGRFAFRTFVRPDVRELPSTVYDAAMNNEINSFTAFKLRLLMAVQETPEQGVVMRNVWRSWHEDGPGPAALATTTGWPKATIATIDAYRDQSTRYSFPTLPMLTAAFRHASFVEIARTTGSYELAERCPTIVLA